MEIGDTVIISESRMTRWAHVADGAPEDVKEKLLEWARLPNKGVISILSENGVGAGVTFGVGSQEKRVYLPFTDLTPL